jgi:thiol-disulfide isomerase/thioredoxin
MDKKSKKPWESPLLWIVVLIAAAVIGTLLLSSMDDGPAVSDRLETSTVAISGAALPLFASPDTAVGTPAPSITATTIDGDRVSFTADGTARLYGFFAHWCSHCQREVPKVVEIIDSGALPADVEVVAISTAVDESATNYPPSSWFEREQWPTTVLLDSESGEIASAYGLTGFPFWVAVDAEGNVAARAAGSLEQNDFLALVDLARG